MSEDLWEVASIRRDELCRKNLFLFNNILARNWTILKHSLKPYSFKLFEKNLNPNSLKKKFGKNEILSLFFKISSIMSLF